jgi:hypothetical protein
MTDPDRTANLISACDAANADAELNSLIDEWQSIPADIEEPWDQLATNNLQPATALLPQLNLRRSLPTLVMLGFDHIRHIRMPL